MNYNENIDITRQTVLNFRFFDANAIVALATDLSLSMTVRDLLLIRDHFRVREQRDPTVGELRFLSALSSIWQKMPASAEVTGIDGNEETTRIWEDIQRMRHALSPAPATLQGLMETAARYLKRSGILPYHSDLICGATADIVARAEGQAPSLAIELNGISAMRAPEVAPASVQARMLVLLFPTGNESFATEVSKFLANHRDLGISVLSAPGKEGILPHLFNLNEGFFLDLAPFALTECPLTASLTLGQNAVLLRVPNEALPRLFAERSPIIVCGALNNSRRVQIRQGPLLHLSLSLDLFFALQSIRTLSLRSSERQEKRISTAVTASKEALLGGVSAHGGCAGSLLTLIGDLLQQGADPNRMTLTAALELPPLDADGGAMADALPAVLELHRTAAELVLPCHGAKALMGSPDTAPKMTVFACAERATPRGEDFAAAWQAATERRDYPTLRRLLRPNL